MKLNFLDCSVIIFVFVSLTIIGFLTRRYTKSVSDFLAANRCAKRYLLSVSEGIAALGSLTVIAYFEMYYKGGFVLVWWGFLVVPLLFIMTLLGWIYYRFRCTRAMTLAQLFEQRYSRGFRVFVGIVAFVSGMLSFGIAPGVTSRFFVQFFQLPEMISLAGFQVSSFLVVMFILMLVSLLFVFWGGQIVVLVTDAIQGVYCNIVFVAIVGVLLYKIDWSCIEEVLLSKTPGLSLVNPLDATKVKSFNMWYFLIGTLGVIYSFSGSATGQSANVSAKTPHEAKMGKIISNWRNIGMYLMLAFVPICAHVIMNHDSMEAISSDVNMSLAQYDDPEVRSQMVTPEVLNRILPKGLLGAFGAMILLAFISTTDTLLHAYGSIFIQDIILPFRKKHFKPRAHLKLLRIAIVCVSFLVFMISAFYEPKQHLLILLASIGAISTAGTGIALIGGLYWKKGTTKGAYGGMIAGAIIATTGIVLNHFIDDFFFDGQWFFLFAMLGASITYVIVSLLDTQGDFDLDSLLHKKDIKSASDNNSALVEKHAGNIFLSRLGVTKEFTKGDKIMYFSVATWGLMLGCLFFVPLIAGIIFKMDNSWWMQLWKFYVFFMFAVACITTLWFTIGALRDIKSLFKDLKFVVRDNNDDGMVEHPVESECDRVS